MTGSRQTISLGGGCFWCSEAVFSKVKGIDDVESGYSNGQTSQPSYEQVCSGATGHNEVVKLLFDPLQISVREILKIFFLIHDPTTLNQQGHDRGTQYRSGIYCSTPEQIEIAKDLIQEMTQSGVYRQPIVTEIMLVANYWPAEDYHQDFFEKNPDQAYCLAVAAPKLLKFRQTFARLVR